MFLAHGHVCTNGALQSFEHKYTLSVDIMTECHVFLLCLSVSAQQTEKLYSSEAGNYLLDVYQPMGLCLSRCWDC